MSDDLVVRAQAGDVDAFSALTSGRMSRLYAIARLILRDDDQAADAVQDALVRAWLDLRALRDPARFDAWLHASSCVPAIAPPAGGGPARSSRSRSATPDTQQVVALRDQLDRSFRRLSPEQRAVIVLHHYRGLSINDCADILGIPPANYEGGGLVIFSMVREVYADPCGPVVRDPAPGPSVDDLASALADVTWADTTWPAAVDLGGHAGKYVELTLPDELGCDPFLLWSNGTGGSRFAQGPGQRFRVWVFQVGGHRALIEADWMPVASRTDLAELLQVVESIQFE